MSFLAASDRIRDKLKPYYLITYRGSAFVVITSALVFGLGWGLVMLFFMFSRTWLAPTVVSSTSDKMLQFVSGYQTVYQNIQTLNVAEAQAERDVVLAKHNSQLLHQLGNETLTYMQKTAVLQNRKRQDIIQSFDLLDEMNTLRSQTEKSLKAGLITKMDATPVFSAIQQFRNGATENNEQYHTLNITTQAQAVQLSGQINQSDNDVLTKTDTLQAVRNSLVVARNEMKLLESTAYFNAQKGANMVFISYENRKIAHVGAPVYDCYLMIIGCHKIGTITHIYHDEQLIEFPLFNIKLSRTARGFLADMDVTNQKGMDSSVLFVGKPFGI